MHERDARAGGPVGHEREHPPAARQRPEPVRCPARVASLLGGLAFSLRVLAFSLRVLVLLLERLAGVGQVTLVRLQTLEDSLPVCSIRAKLLDVRATGRLESGVTFVPFALRGPDGRSRKDDSGERGEQN
jgi:hypothetical protein